MTKIINGLNPRVGDKGLVAQSYSTEIYWLRDFRFRNKEG